MNAEGKLKPLTQKQHEVLTYAHHLHRNLIPYPYQRIAQAYNFSTPEAARSFLRRIGDDTEKYLGHPVPTFGANWPEHPDISLLELPQTDDPCRWSAPIKKESCTDWRSSFDTAIEVQKRYEEQSVAQQEALVDFTKIGRPVLLLHTGEWHLEDPETNLRGLRDMLETVLDTPYCYLDLVGDEISNWGMSAYDGLNRATMTPQAAHYVVFDILQELDKKKKLLAMALGCHGFHADKHGVQEEDTYYKTLEHVQIMPGGGLMTVKMPGALYRIFLAHKYRTSSRANPTVANKRVAQLEEDADIVVLGHIHTPTTEAGPLRKQDRFYCVVNSWKGLDRYAARKGFRPIYSTMQPCHILRPDYKKITPFAYLDDGLTHLKALQQEYE